MWIYFWALGPVSLIYVSVFILVPSYFAYCSFSVLFEVRVWYLQFHSSFSRIFWLLSLLCFHTNFLFICSSSVKNTMHILLGIVLDSWIALDSVVILTIFIPPIQSLYHWIYLSMCSCHLQFLSSVFYSFLNMGLFLP